MQHRLSKDFFQYWKNQLPGEGLPHLSDFTPEKLAEFDECGLILSLQHGDIKIDYLGERNEAVLSADLLGRPITDLFPPALKAMQMALLMPCILQKVGLIRRSRIWFGHRHKDVEWLFLPVVSDEDGPVAIVGLAVTFVDSDERDEVVVGSPMVERIVTQNYVSLGNQVNISGFDSHSRAVLDAMGTKTMIDGHEVPSDDRGIAGEAGMVAAKASRPNVLAVVDPSDIGNVSERLGGRYNLRTVASFDEARAILRSDMIDILVTAESSGHGAGLDLINDAQGISAFTACVVMLDRRAEAKDARVEENGSLTHHLVKPVGEFALRQALDDAGKHVDRARREDAS